MIAVLDLGIPRFLQQLETEPALSNGHFIGFRLLSFFPNDPRFSALDLRVGDVVTSINGLPVERPEHALRIWQELRVASEIRVRSLRGGAQREILFEITDG